MFAKGAGFRLNFAPHLGFPSPQAPLFNDLLQDASPRSQIAFAAANGFKCVQDPFAILRPELDQLAIGQVAQEYGVELGCFVYAAIEQARLPQWTVTDVGGRKHLADQVGLAIATGKRIGARHIVVFTGVDRSRSRAEQIHALSINLERTIDQVAEANMILCLEAVDAQRLPNMLLHHLSDAIAVVRAINHPCVRLVFDTGHVQAMDGDILRNMDLAWDLIELFQIADHPGRVEPGAGELNCVRIIDELDQRKFSGPVELEHGWSMPDAERQRQYLQWLSRWKN